MKIRAALADTPRITFNSNDYGIPHILNLSIIGRDSDASVDKLSEQGIYLTARSACSGREGFSKSVYAITHDNSRAISSLRVSLSHLTSDEETDRLITALKELAT
jgi:cysteine desulfurase